MKSPSHFSFLLCTLCLALTAALVDAADSTGLDALQGTWSTKRTNQEGQVASQVLEFKQDRMTFKITGPDNAVRFYAKGAVAVQKLGPFQTLKITGIEAGRSEDSLQAVDDDRTSVFALDGDTFVMASNFDKERANQKPRVETYLRSEAKEDAAAKLAGTWKMTLHFGENDTEYQLRFEQADGKLGATLISPRSGEHKFRMVTLADDKLSMELDRDYSGAAVTLLYKGTLGTDGLSGTVVAKGAEDQFSGAWKARK